jgi:hypothetical protein
MKFTPWSKFDSRAELGNSLQYPGIYSLAISRKNLTASPFDWIPEIVYFGMTNSKAGLRGRLNAFNNTLRDKSGPGHGGAERFLYEDKYWNDREVLAKKLYVSVAPFPCEVTSISRENLTVMGDVVRAEYLAWAEYAARHGALPKYNDKKISPKRPRPR